MLILSGKAGKATLEVDQIADLDQETKNQNSLLR